MLSRLRVLSLAGLLVVAGCSSSSETDSFVEAPVEVLYNQATDALLAERYVEAARLFNEVERQHPYSVWATRAQLMAAYANYARDRHDEAIAALDRFIQLNPGNRDVGYAYYLRALAYYEQIVDVGRDQANTLSAMAAFEDVIRRFPDSTYARDARVRMDLIRDHLAGKEMEVGRFYQRRGQCTASMNRYRRVIEQFQTTSHVPEALHRLVECSLQMGLREEARMVAAVLGHNFPGSPWYAESYLLLEGVDLRPAEAGSSGGVVSWLTRLWPF
ncbi:MAG: outer membrane protein assembly factor BamD [Alphaproteobacteria bacterium]|nr:outer membrane protein assembly factor BamD [Alphaproteobacteria bacterium]TAD88520.1 MAG: outer membrane protein assembly factor BamD [Alphaproteobacteria bacterium]